MNSRLVVLLLFFVSGISGLVYEVVWARQLSLIFGITTFATSTVLAAYMGGLALGSWWVGRFIDRVRNPVRVYALLEGGIGIIALLIPVAFWAARQIYIGLSGPLESQFLLFNFARAMIAFVILLVPTTLMGGTVPAIGRFLTRRQEEIGWNVGLLYALNTGGAVIGVVLSGFWLVPEFGLQFAARLAAAINLAIAAGLLVSGLGESDAQAPPVPLAEPTAGQGVEGAFGRRLAVAVFAVSGLVALAYEVIWSRVLVVHIFNTTYAFSTMLATFLAGLAIGDALLIRFYDRIQRPLFWLGVVQVGIGLSVVAAAAAYIPLDSFSLGFLGVDGASFTNSVGGMFLRASLVLLPSTLLLGMMFPLVARTVCSDVASIGKSLGTIYAANTFGSILGALGAAFVLIPVFGLRGSILVLSGVNIIMGAACWLASVRSALPRSGLVALAGACMLIPSLMIPESIFSDPLTEGPLKLIYHHEGVSDTTGVVEWASGERVVIYGDQRGTAGTLTNDQNRFSAHLAHLLHPRPVRSLQIGFGVGNTLAAAALHPEVERLDCVELSPQVRETARFFWTNQNVLAHPKVNLIIDDGRNYLLRTDVDYDVITLEPPNIYSAGVVNLYTREFYQLAADALADDGVLLQWISVADTGEDDLRRMVRAMLEVFPETLLWDQGAVAMFDAPTGFLHLVGSKRPLRINVAELGRRMAHPALHDDLEAIGSPDPADLLALFIAGPATTRRWTDGVEAISDDRTVVDFSTARSVYSGFGLRFWRLEGEDQRRWMWHLGEIGRWWQRLRDPVSPLLVETSDPETLNREIATRHAVFDRRVTAWLTKYAQKAE